MINASQHNLPVSLSEIQKYLTGQQIDGWLLYDFRGQNPIALHMAGLERSGTRRWFLWIPAQGSPSWLIHAIETSTFADVRPDLAGEFQHYINWQQIAKILHKMINESIDASPNMTTAQRPRIAMEYSPDCAIPYVSKVDAGMKELVESATSAEIVSSADLVQLVQAVLSAEQMQSHRRAAAHVLTAKNLAFNFIRQELNTGSTPTEYDVQQRIIEYFLEQQMDYDHAPIVAVNAHAADPHYAPTIDRHKSIRQGDIVLLDIWAREQNSSLDCFADVTWTGYCDHIVPDSVQAIFQVVATARDRAVRFIQERLDQGKPVYGYEVDEVCRGSICDAGYGDYILHRTGHSLGPAVHFNGVNIDNLETQDKRRLIPGVMFTIEPGVYMPTFNFDDSPQAKGLGIRSEINCYMHADHAEVTTLPLQETITAIL